MSEPAPPHRALLAALLVAAAVVVAPRRAYAADSLALATVPAPATTPTSSPTAESRAAQRNGREIYQRFRQGLADPDCGPQSSARWKQHFATAPGRLAESGDDMLPLFGYVVDALREASLPTEYALIPMIESGYRPGARSPAGPAGLWQLIALTARNHGVPIRPGYDGRLSPVESTRAAVRYLKTLHGMFAGDWRLAAMAYNAGEYRIFGALKRAGQKARNATPESLPGVSDLTHAYVRKIHALSCVLEQADQRDEWLRSLDRPVPRLQAITLPGPVHDLAGWAANAGQDLAQLRRLNPAIGDGRIPESRGHRAPVLAAAPASGGTGVLISSAESTGAATAPARPGDATATAATSATPAGTAPGEQPQRRHTVRAGENPWLIARRYGMRVVDLLQRNALSAGSTLRPGQVLQIDPLSATSE